MSLAKKPSEIPVAAMNPPTTEQILYPNVLTMILPRGAGKTDEIIKYRGVKVIHEIKYLSQRTKTNYNKTCATSEN